MDSIKDKLHRVRMTLICADIRIKWYNEFIGGWGDRYPPARALWEQKREITKLAIIRLKKIQKNLENENSEIRSSQ